MKYNYQIFNNVTTKEEFLSNIKTAATANGWICDKDDINANNELYLHSTGNGNQNLYFSMKIAYNYQAYYMAIHGNTGFNTGAAWDAQPGKFTSLTVLGYFNNRALPYLWFPISRQYVLVNKQTVLVFSDMIGEGLYLNGTRIITHFVFGAIDSYKPNETEGNLSITYQIAYTDNGYTSGILGVYIYNWCNTVSNNVGLLYHSENKFNNDLGITTWKYDNYNSHNGDSYHKFGRRGYHYTDAVQYNDWMSRTALIKPIVSIKHIDAENEYFYPIGELPYYACKVYPYSKAGEIITYGTKKFMTFPLLRYTYGDGVAVEINE